MTDMNMIVFFLISKTAVWVFRAWRRMNIHAVRSNATAGMAINGRIQPMIKKEIGSNSKRYDIACICQIFIFTIMYTYRF